MYLNTGSNYYIVPFKGRVVYTQSGLSIKDPNFMVRLLTLSEFTKLDTLRRSGDTLSSLHEEIFTVCYLGLLGFESEVLNAEDTAFVIDAVASVVLAESTKYFLDPEPVFNICLEQQTKVEIWCGFIANLLHLPYDTLVLKPIDEIVRLYAIAYVISGGQIPNITLKPKEE